jgi:hypothetical protein
MMRKKRAAAFSAHVAPSLAPWALPCASSAARQPMLLRRVRAVNKARRGAGFQAERPQMVDWGNLMCSDAHYGLD